MAALLCACALLSICLSDVVTARRSDTAHVSGQTKVATPTNTHTESFDTSKFASETAESEVCVLSFIKWKGMQSNDYFPLFSLDMLRFLLYYVTVIIP